MENKILLLGSKGFIGNFLFSNLQYNIVPISRAECDLTDFKSVTNLLKKHSPEIIINCAGNLHRSLDSFDTKLFNQNLNIFLNFYNQKDFFGKFINVGSGAEYDRRYSIDLKREDEIKFIRPTDHYGLSKNIVANICASTDNFYTFRIFGCLSNSNNALFDKIIQNKHTTINNRYFDFFYIYDLIPIFNYFIHNSPSIKDVNIVYKEKNTLQKIISFFINYHNLKSKVLFEEEYKNYTGCSETLDSFNFQFQGLEEGMKQYII